jgi:hypothetical protein
MPQSKVQASTFWRQSGRSAGNSVRRTREKVQKKKSIQMLLDSPKCASSPLGRTQYVRRAAPFHGAPPVLFPAHHSLPARIGSPTPRARVHTGPPMRTWPRTSYEQRELLPSLRSGTRRRAPAAQLLRSHMSRSHSHHGADVALPVPPPTPSVGHLTPAHVLPGPPIRRESGAREAGPYHAPRFRPQMGPGCWRAVWSVHARRRRSPSQHVTGQVTPTYKAESASTHPDPSRFLSLTLSPFTPWWAGRTETGPESSPAAARRSTVPDSAEPTVRRLPISHPPSRRRRVSRAGCRRRRWCRSARRHRRSPRPIRLENLVEPRGLDSKDLTACSSFERTGCFCFPPLLL